mgnify:CR=1 FL=1
MNPFDLLFQFFTVFSIAVFGIYVISLFVFSFQDETFELIDYLKGESYLGAWNYTFLALSFVCGFIWLCIGLHALIF